jgi:hypothetical protein
MDAAKSVTATFNSEGGGGGDYIRVEQDDGSVGYAGTWFPLNNVVLSGGTAVQAMDAGSVATFTFNGTSARWIGYKDQWSGIARVYVDGVLQGEIDTYDPDNVPQQIMYTTPSLSSGTHTLTIEVTQTRNGASSGFWIWVDAFEYVP